MRPRTLRRRLMLAGLGAILAGAILGGVAAPEEHRPTPDVIEQVAQ